MPYLPESDSMDVFNTTGDPVVLEILESRFTGPMLTTLQTECVMCADDDFPNGPARWLLRLPRLVHLGDDQYGYALVVAPDLSLTDGGKEDVDVLFVHPRFTTSDPRTTRSGYRDCPTFTGQVWLGPVVFDVGFPDEDDSTKTQARARRWAFTSPRRATERR